MSCPPCDDSQALLALTLLTSLWHHCCTSTAPSPSPCVEVVIGVPGGACVRACVGHLSIITSEHHGVDTLSTSLPLTHRPCHCPPTLYLYRCEGPRSLDGHLVVFGKTYKNEGVRNFDDVLVTFFQDAEINATDVRRPLRVCVCGACKCGYVAGGSVCVSTDVPCACASVGTYWYSGMKELRSSMLTPRFRR